MDKVLRALRRKLERWELGHLRVHALELHERLECAEAEAQRNEDNAEFWRENYMRMEEAFHDEDFATHRSIGLTKTGELLVVKHERS